MNHCNCGDTISQLYLDFFEISLKTFVLNDVTPSLTRYLNEGTILEGMIEQWDNYSILSFYLIRVFGYLDRFYTRTAKSSTEKTRHLG